MTVKFKIKKQISRIYSRSSHLLGVVSGLYFLRMQRIRKSLEQRPLLLAIETVSLCNARCVFCVYPTMKRKKEIMPMDLFRKIIGEYSRLGGGALSLTPVMGDLFLDPFIIQRYEALDEFKNINQISFTTNGIALSKFSDDQLKYILNRSFLIQFSIGGLDPDTYKRLYEVNQFEAVMSSVKRVMRLNNEIQEKVHIILAFRTDNPQFENEYASQLDEFRRQGVIVSHISAYYNFGGTIKTDKVKLKKNNIVAKRLTCALPLINPHVYSNGKITTCGCADAEGNGLIIGNGNKDTVIDSWRGKRRNSILNSFSRGKPPKLCQECTAYRPNTFLGSGIFKDVALDKKLPLDFYIKFMGG